MHAISQQQLELAKTTDMDEKNLADFNRLMGERKVLMDKVDALRIPFGDIRNMTEYQSDVDVIQGTIKAITDNDKICGRLMQEKLTAAGAKLTDARINKKARMAYMPNPSMTDAWFFDAKK